MRTAFEPGERIVLPIDRRRAEPADGDELLLRHCTGPTLDVGCGPGRLTVALVRRGVVALGVDISPVAVRLTVERGGPALRRDVFGRVPGEGRWRHALLADGSIGIGGDPIRLLRRVSELLCRGGTALVELEPPGANALAETARESGLYTRWVQKHGNRWFACLALV